MPYTDIVQSVKQMNVITVKRFFPNFLLIASHKKANEATFC